MLNNFFISNSFYALLFVSIAIVIPQTSKAQQCEAHYEMVTKLYHPDPGSYTVWDSAYGKDQRDEAFVSVVNLEKDVLAVGEMRSAVGGAPSLMFVHFDHRGRKIREKHHKISGLRGIVKMLRHGDGYLVMANRRKSQARTSLWLGFFDKNLALVSQKTIEDKSFDLLATDIIVSANGQGWVVSVTAESTMGEGKNKTLRKKAFVYLLDKNGNDQFSRGYIMGKDSEILGLTVSKFDGGGIGYIATGYFENNIGKQIAWVLRLHADLSLVWQREYGRGLSAKIKMSAGYRDRYVLVFGDVLPADSNPWGGWLMLLDGDNGQTMWQRYYHGGTGHHDYSAQGMYVSKGGLITLMMMARSKVSVIDMVYMDDKESLPFDDKIIPENMDYAHLLTLSPRGVTLSGDSYYYGRGVSISQMIEGHNGGRVMAGYAHVRVKDKVEEIVKVVDVNPPLKEKGYINLPDVDLSEKTKEGLAMLKNKLNEQEAHSADNSGHHEVEKQKESAMHEIGHNVVTRDGWVLIGDMPDTYTDPCRR
ncbi:MAG: hypothetical protein COB36_02400 [Alphaproteobacteria bacterium]|nr:MAG: hypothetical protein COB36_02400 [Alphaproteobacteria bacterium]